MQIQVKDLGNGLYKVEAKTNQFEAMRSSTVDNAVREFIKNRRGSMTAAPAQPQSTTTQRRPNGYGVAKFQQPEMCCQHKHANQTPRNGEKQCAVVRDGKKVHGIDIHVDVPERKDFVYGHEWRQAMQDFRNLEELAKKCDWPCKEPPSWAPKAKPQFEAPSCWDDDDDLEWEDDEWEDDDVFVEEEACPFYFFGCRF